MANGFFGYDEDGNEIFDANNIVYGLRQSGPMQFITRLYRYLYKSTNLDPNDPGSYGPTGNFDPIYGFSVYGADAPIVFIHGTGLFVGSVKQGDVTTFRYMGANENTRFYYFDVMKDAGPIAGVKTYRDDAANTLVFNSAMVPMNIAGAYTAPPPSAVISGWPGVRTQIWNGGTKRFYRGTTVTSDAALLMFEIDVAIPGANWAAYSTFSRSFGIGLHDSGPSTIAGYNPARTYSFGGQDGVYGGNGKITWVGADSSFTYMRTTTYGVMGTIDVPTDRYPQALIVNIDTLPYPYTAGW